LLVENVDEVVSHDGVIVMGNGDPAFRKFVSEAEKSKSIVNLVRIGSELRTETSD